MLVGWLMAENPTEGMYIDNEGTVHGAVAISANPQQLEDSQKTTFSEQLTELYNSADVFVTATPTTLMDTLTNSAKVNALQVQATLKSAEMVKNSNLNIAVNIANNTMQSQYNMIVSSQILEQIIQLNDKLDSFNTNLEALTTATENQQLQLSTESISMGNMTVNTEGIVNAISQGVTNQIETNAKIVENLTKQNLYIDTKSEHLEFVKNGNAELKDSRGNTIKPREIEALKNAELHFAEKEENNTDYLKSVSDLIGNQIDENSEYNLLQEVYNSFLNVDVTKIDEAIKGGK